MEAHIRGTVHSFTREAHTPARPRTRESRISRKAIVVIQPIGGNEGTRIRADLSNSSSQGLGLRVLVPITCGIQLIVSVFGEGVTPELILCHVKHCTKLQSGWYNVGVQILQRLPGNLHTTRIPDAWRQPAL